MGAIINTNVASLNAQRNLGKSNGVLTQALSWHWIFVINVPLGLLAIGAGADVVTLAGTPVKLCREERAPLRLGLQEFEVAVAVHHEAGRRHRRSGFPAPVPSVRLRRACRA